MLITIFIPLIIQPVKANSNSTVGSYTWSWTRFWQKFKSYSAWVTEWYDGEAWINHDNCMQIIREHPQENITKITLNFTSQEAGDYRFTFGIDQRVKSYVDKSGQYQYNLTFHGFTIIFDWSDIKDVSGLQLTHGIKNNMFWFRIRRDNVPATYNVVLDPSLVATSSQPQQPFGYSYQRFVFQAQNLHWVFYVDQTDYIRYKTSSDAINWSDATNVRSGVLDGYYFSVWNNETHMDYVFQIDGYGASFPILWRRGRLYGNGTIIWLDSEQTVATPPASVGYWYHSITVDSNGCPWIGYKQIHITDIFNPA